MANILWKGIDVSVYQKNVDYNKVKSAGYDFVIIRAGYGREESQIDPEFEKHYTNAKAAGMMVGAYWYNYAKTPSDALKEAQVFKKALAGKQFDMPVYYDIEEQSVFNTGAYNVDKIATTFCNEMEAAGYWCGIYGGQYLATSLLSSNTRNRYAFWLAQYLKNPTYTGTYGIWQYSVAGDKPGNNPAGVSGVPGVNGQCDLDYCYVDYPTQIKKKGLNGYPKTEQSNQATTAIPAVKVTPIKEFIPRKTIPESGNKYYNTPNAGGYAEGIILGNPTKSGLNVLANCVGYAAARFNEIIAQNKFVYFTYAPNAEDFISRAKSYGLTVTQKPEVGSIIVWAKGKVGNSGDGAGHVAIVEQVNNDGTIITSESGYGCSNPFWISTRSNTDGKWGAGSAYTFLGFVKNPAIDANTKITGTTQYTTNKCPYTEPKTSLKEGSNGDGVKWMQWYLKEYGYYVGDIDGKFGKVTLGALLAFQFKQKLTVDGICGPNTRKAIKNYKV